MTMDEALFDPVAEVVPVLREVLAARRLTLQLASDRQIVDGLLGNVAADDCLHPGSLICWSQLRHAVGRPPRIPAGPLRAVGSGLAALAGAAEGHVFDA